MARPRTLKEIEPELFNEGLEKEYCITAIFCEDCPESNNPKCPANEWINCTQVESEQSSLNRSAALDVAAMPDVVRSSVFSSNLMRNEIGLT